MKQTVGDNLFVLENPQDMSYSILLNVIYCAIFVLLCFSILFKSKAVITSLSSSVVSCQTFAHYP